MSGANYSKLIYAAVGASEEQIEASHKELRQYLRAMSVPSDHPAVGDMIAAELEEAQPGAGESCASAAIANDDVPVPAVEELRGALVNWARCEVVRRPCWPPARRVGTWREHAK